MSLFQNRAGIRITGTKLQIVEVNYEEKNLFLENVDEHVLSEIISEDFPESKLISIIQEAFDQLTSRKTLKTNFVSILLPLNFYKTITLPIEKSLSSEERAEQIKWEFSVIFPEDNSDDYIFQMISIEQNQSSENQVCIAIKRNTLMMIHKFCARNNLSLKFVDHPSISTNQFVITNLVNDQDDEFYTILFENNSFSLIYVEQKKIKSIIVKTFSEPKDSISILNQIFGQWKRATGGCKLFISSDFDIEMIRIELEQSFGFQIQDYNPLVDFQKSETFKSENIIENDASRFTPTVGTSTRLT